MNNQNHPFGSLFYVEMIPEIKDLVMQLVKTTQKEDSQTKPYIKGFAGNEACSAENASFLMGISKRKFLEIVNRGLIKPRTQERMIFNVSDIFEYIEYEESKRRKK